jgi:hypothetical protein
VRSPIAAPRNATWHKTEKQPKEIVPHPHAENQALSSGGTTPTAVFSMRQPSGTLSISRAASSTLFELSFCYAAAQIFPRKKPKLPVDRLRIL